MIDVDCFKQFNDTHGHPSGDRCLKSVAQTLSQVARRPQDIVARYGGEEFAFILPDCDLDGAQHLAETCREAMAALAISHCQSSVSEHITISVGGVTTGPGAFVSPLELVSTADANLFQAKQGGRDQCVVVKLDAGWGEEAVWSSPLERTDTKAYTATDSSGLLTPASELSLEERERYLDLLSIVSTTANEAKNMPGAIESCLKLVCEHTLGPVGHAYIRDEDEPDTLVSSGLWYADHPQDFETLREVTQRTRFKPGVGLPGRVLVQQKPAWIVDVTKDDNYPRAKAVENIGIRAAFAFPILAGSEVSGVLEFFSPTVEMPNHRLLDLMLHVGTQLGRVDEREKSRRRLSFSERRFRDFASVAADFFWETDAALRFTFGSGAFGETIGYPANSFEGVPLLDVWGGQMEHAVAATDNKHYQSISFDYSVTHFDGEINTTIAYCWPAGF